MSSDQQQPYDPGYDPYYGEQQGQYGRQPEQGQAQPQGQGQGQYGQQPYGYQDPHVTQTWEGQTWDTQYQPVVDPAQLAAAQQGQAPQPGHAAHQAPAAHQAHEPQQAPAAHQAHEPQGLAADTAYLPPQSAAYPLPEEAPVAAEAAPAPESAPGWSSPTTSGHTRLTDAQRARAEGRSPIIAPGFQPALLTAGLGVLLAVGAALGTYGLLVPLVLLQAVTAAGWFRLNGMWPARQGIALAFAGGLTADVVLLAAGRENAPAAIMGTLGVWVLLTLVLQLRSHADPDERMYGLMATVASAALTIVATGHLGAAPDAVVVGGLAVAAAVVARALPLPGAASVVVALLAAAGAGIAAGALTDLGSSGALLGLGAGVCALVGLRAASYDYPSRFVHMTAGVALPLTLAAPAVYLLGRALA
ncbi:hypothetical protein ACGFYP_15185 [Streptomyces sp. NPDC048370]|uniref:hypothetical protein n=1 Tax=Streptomyces sp. NPDC048370 TaxID=3365540 RepID=UPI00371FB393